ncbi:uncharacterized protein LOC134540616 isoform X2 [Bacillus rossius redtenbacheri]|uniref:uncharacterized protein LOC134540616 isoform X2 n=1 Tax=Bacillus rossius redtenbacheri TaxID=93214 RepID=UPI002FDDA0B0
MESDLGCNERTFSFEGIGFAAIDLGFKDLEHVEVSENVNDTQTRESTSVHCSETYKFDDVSLTKITNSNENFRACNLLTTSQFIDDITNDLGKNLAAGNSMILKNSPFRSHVDPSTHDERSVYIESHLFWKPQECSKDNLCSKGGNVTICPKERKRWAVPASASGNHHKESLDVSWHNVAGLPIKSSVMDNLAHQGDDIRKCGGVNVIDRYEASRMGNLDLSDTPLLLNRSQENDCKNLLTSDHVPQAPSPSSVSSVTSSRRLEWDSGADVGYMSQGLVAGNRIEMSTIERIALARGCTAVLCSRMDPGKTPASGNPHVSAQDPCARDNEPIAHSTPVERNVAQTELASSATGTDCESEITPILRPATKPGGHVSVCRQIQQGAESFGQHITKHSNCRNNVPASEPIGKTECFAGLGAKHSNSLTDLPKCDRNTSADNRTNSLPRSHDKIAHPSMDRYLVDRINKNTHHSASSSSVATVVCQQKLLPSDPVCVVASKEVSSLTIGVRQQVGELAEEGSKNPTKPLNTGTYSKSCTREEYHVDHLSENHPPSGKEVADMSGVLPQQSGAEERCGTAGSIGSSAQTGGTPLGESSAPVGSANSFEYLPGPGYDEAALTDGKTSGSLSDGAVGCVEKLLQGVDPDGSGVSQLLMQHVCRKFLDLPDLPTPREVPAAAVGASRIPEADSSDVSSTVFKPHRLACERTLTAAGEVSSSAAESRGPSDSTGRDWGSPATRSERAFKHRWSQDQPAGAGIAGKSLAPLLEFCEGERASQLSWIQMEIDHLQNLKQLLAGQNVLSRREKGGTSDGPRQTSAAPTCTLMKITRNTLQASRSETSTTTECERSISVTHDWGSVREVECRAGVRQIVSRRSAARLPPASPARADGSGESLWAGREARARTRSVGVDAGVQAAACRCERSASVRDVGGAAAFNCHDPHGVRVEHECPSSKRGYAGLLDVSTQVPSAEDCTGEKANARVFMSYPRDREDLRNTCAQVPSSGSVTERSCVTSRRNIVRLCEASTQVPESQSFSGKRDDKREHVISRRVDEKSDACTQVPSSENVTQRSGNGHGSVMSRKINEKICDACTKLTNADNITDKSCEAHANVTSQRGGDRSNVCTQVPSFEKNTRSSASRHSYVTTEKNYEKSHDVCTQHPSSDKITGKGVSRHEYVTSQRDIVKSHNVCTQIPSSGNFAGRSLDKHDPVESQKNDEKLGNMCTRVPSVQDITQKGDERISWREVGRTRNICTQVPSAQDDTERSKKSLRKLYINESHGKRSKEIAAQADISSHDATPMNSGTLEGISEGILDSNRVSYGNVNVSDRNKNRPDIASSQVQGTSRNETSRPMCCCECRRALRRLTSENRTIFKGRDADGSEAHSGGSVLPKCRMCGMWLNECADGITGALLGKPQSIGGSVPAQEGSAAGRGRRCPCCFSIEEESSCSTSSVEESVSAVRSSRRRKPGGVSGPSTPEVCGARGEGEHDLRPRDGPILPRTPSPGSDPPPPVGYILTLESSPSMDSGVQLEDGRARRRSLSEVKVKVPSRRRAARKKTKSDPDTGGKRDASTRENAYGKKRTLQEWLAMNRPDFVAVAETRRRLLRELAELREARGLGLQQALVSGARGPDALPPPPLAVKRIFDQRSMRRQTEEKYRRLPEVRNKKTERKRKEDYRTNRLMAEIFTRKLQTKVLKGEVNLSNSVSVISNF